MVVEINEDSICSTQWGGRWLEAQLFSCGANTWTHSLASTHLVSRGGRSSSGIPGACGEGLN